MIKTKMTWSKCVLVEAKVTRFNTFTDLIHLPVDLLNLNGIMLYGQQVVL